MQVTSVSSRAGRFQWAVDILYTVDILPYYENRICLFSFSSTISKTQQDKSSKCPLGYNLGTRQNQTKKPQLPSLSPIILSIWRAGDEDLKAWYLWCSHFALAKTSQNAAAKQLWGNTGMAREFANYLQNVWQHFKNTFQKAGVFCILPQNVHSNHSSWARPFFPEWGWGWMKLQVAELSLHWGGSRLGQAWAGTWRAAAH